MFAQMRGIPPATMAINVNGKRKIVNAVNSNLPIVVASPFFEGVRYPDAAWGALPIRNQTRWQKKGGH